MSNQLLYFDFTLKADGISADELIDWCEEYCDKWCFQLEKGSKKDYLHYQGRFKLIKRKRLETLIKETEFDWHLSITSEANKNNLFYVTKEDTRVDGPWMDATNKKKAERPPHLVKITDDKLYPFQLAIKAMCNEYDERKCNVIYDPKGCRGKTSIVTILMCEGVGMRLPPPENPKELMEAAYAFPNCKNFFIDMPRALKKETYRAIYGKIELIKDGYIFDTRYRFQLRKDPVTGGLNFYPPNVFVFTNHLPDSKWLSLDRWCFFKIDSKNRLKKINPFEKKNEEEE
jgi:Putative viral replication protein.